MREDALRVRRPRFPRRLVSPLLWVCLITLALWLPFFSVSALASTRDHRRAQTAAPAGFFGVHPRSASASDFARMRSAGVGIARTGWVYSQLKPSPYSPLQWGVFDANVADAARARIDLLPVLLGAPSWLGESVPLTGVSAASWRLYLAALVSRYGPDGSFWAAHPELPYRPIRSWQIWNEPNALSNWNDAPDPVGYARLLESSAAVIHSIDPRAEIVSAGVISLPVNPRAPAALPYLKKMLRARSTREAIDALAIHPYAGEISQIKRQLTLTRRLLDRLGMRRTPITVTEISWGSGRPGHNPLIVSPKTQRQKLRESFQMLSRERQRLQIEHVIWYQWRDGPNGECVWCSTAGLLTSTGKSKPLLQVYSSLATANRR